jgi:hypothetical protein
MLKADSPLCFATKGAVLGFSTSQSPSEIPMAISRYGNGRRRGAALASLGLSVTPTPSANGPMIDSHLSNGSTTRWMKPSQGLDGGEHARRLEDHFSGGCWAVKRA